jgi:hypothetical protein
MTLQINPLNPRSAGRDVVLGWQPVLEPWLLAMLRSARG